MPLDCRSRELINSGMKLRFFGKHFPHNLFVSLGQQAASAVKYRGNFRLSGIVIIQEPPVSVVPVEITQQRIRNKHIPEMRPKNRQRDILLPVDGIHDIIQLRTAAVAVGIENRILDRTEVEQPLPSGGKVFAGTHGLRFSLDSVVAEDRFLCRNPQHIENAAGNVFADTAVGIGQLCWLPVPGGRKLQHIDLTSIRNRDLTSVGSVISAPRDNSAVCKVNHCFPPNKNFFRR